MAEYMLFIICTLNIPYEDITKTRFITQLIILYKFLLLGPILYVEGKTDMHEFYWY